MLPNFANCFKKLSKWCVWNSSGCCASGSADSLFNPTIPTLLLAASHLIHYLCSQLCKKHCKCITDVAFLKVLCHASTGCHCSCNDTNFMWKILADNSVNEDYSNDPLKQNGKFHTNDWIKLIYAFLSLWASKYRTSINWLLHFSHYLHIIYWYIYIYIYTTTYWNFFGLCILHGTQ